MVTLFKLLTTTIIFFAMSAHAAENEAIMLEKVEDPMLGMANIMGSANADMAKKMMGESAKAIDYRHCIQNVSMENFNELAANIQDEADENDQYNDTKLVTLIQNCPLPANGQCEHGDRTEFFYTTSLEVLSEQKDSCEYFNKVWRSSDSPIQKNGS